MKQMLPYATTILFILLFTAIPSENSKAQSDSGFDLNEYLDFLSANSNLTTAGIMDRYPASTFGDDPGMFFNEALYADTVQQFYQLNDEEIGLLEKQSFMVTDRIRYKSFGEAYFTIYKRDLPVYISSDAILHALHMSYSEILISLEFNVLIPKLKQLLTGLHDEVSTLKNTYSQFPEMQTSLRDSDLYLTIPLLLLEEEVNPHFEENIEEVENLMSLIESEQMVSYPLFSSLPRDIDFSQFTPRGHYTRNLKLTNYFKAMIWLGRTEFYLIVPNAFPYTDMTQEQRDSLAQRQSISAYLVKEALENSGEQQVLHDINEITEFLVGESDNVTTDHLAILQDRTGFENASSLTDIETYRALRDTLENEPFAFQRILSQVLMKNPSDPEKIRPASAFLLLGQRFIIDSFVLGNVVFDKVDNPKRMLPKSADVLFALGNNDALAVLSDELDRYHYAPQLNALRYLIDQYEPEYWMSSFFNLWLNAIRSLNPSDDTRNGKPEFMLTEAWTHKNMTTQLASWSQLRHDNLLYAKQSYSGGAVCSYPHSYVEPVPEFFNAMVTLADEAMESFDQISALDENAKKGIKNYFQKLRNVNEKLAGIAQKQIDGIDTNEDEKAFLQGMLHEFRGCVVELSGWYVDLFYTGESGALKEDFIVADVHTAPTDEIGNIVGWVVHAGTGPLNLAVVAAELGDGQKYTFVGPVMSYYEHVSTNFKRLTDEEWVTTFEDAPSMRPGFESSYLFASGEFYYDHRNLTLTSVADVPSAKPDRMELSQNYPNPFNAGTMIGFKIPSELADQRVELLIYNVQGQVIATLIDRPMPAGNYSVRWESNAGSGVYFYHLRIAGQEQTGKMTLLK